jgi:cell division protease FtsH
MARHQDYGEETALRIDQEVRRIVSENYERARRMLVEYKAVLVNIADELLTREVLDGEQVRRLVMGLSLDEPQPALS